MIAKEATRTHWRVLTSKFSLSPALTLSHTHTHAHTHRRSRERGGRKGRKRERERAAVFSTYSKLPSAHTFGGGGRGFQPKPTLPGWLCDPWGEGRGRGKVGRVTDNKSSLLSIYHHCLRRLQGKGVLEKKKKNSDGCHTWAPGLTLGGEGYS